MLLTNGRIYTMDGRHAVVDTLVVRDGRIAFAGSRDEVNVPDSEEVIDLSGRMALPGLVDGHAHLMGLARARLSLNATGSTSEDAVAGQVREAAAKTPAGGWIIGRGWDQTLWPGGRFPTRRTLDGVAPRHPVALTRIDGHAMWVNTAALRWAGIHSETADPTGGLIVRDDDGEPTGLLIDTAQRMVQDITPLPSAEQFDRAVEDAIAECLRKGLTGIHEMGVDLYGFASYRRLIAGGRFPFRNYAAVAGRSADTWKYFKEHGMEELGDGRLVVRSLKLVADGALGSRGAALHEPYCDDPHNTGLILLPPDELVQLAREGHEHGFQVCVHAIGDAANTLTLDTFEQVLSDSHRREQRHRVEHAQILRPVDIPRFRQLGVLPSMQATHCTSDMRYAEERLGPERLAGAYAWRSLIDSGVIIPNGSDFPVEDANPFHGIYASVTRRPLSGEDAAWQPQQRMTREEAVRSFTTWNAVGSHQEAVTGSLEPGKWADLIVLSDDVFTCSAERIKDIVPLLTMVDGRVEYRAPSSDD